MADDTPPADEQVPDWVGAMHQTCVGCQTTDNHPKKIVIFDLQDASRDQVWHHDCHAYQAGDKHSMEVVRQSGGLKGHALRVFLHGDPEQGHAPRFVAPSSQQDQDQQPAQDAPAVQQNPGV